MAVVEEKSIRIEKFSGEDFSFLKIQIEDYLYKKKHAFSSFERKANRYEG